MRESRHQRAYHWLLRLYPGWFRGLYAAQMETDFTEMLDSCRASPQRARATARAWITVVRDLVQSLPREWLATFRRPASSNHPLRKRTAGDAVSSMLSDIRYAVRSWRRNPGFVLLVVLTLAVGIGVNVAMFSVADAVLFSPLPYPSADRLA